VSASIHATAFTSEVPPSLSGSPNNGPVDDVPIWKPSATVPTAVPLTPTGVNVPHVNVANTFVPAAVPPPAALPNPSVSDTGAPN